MDLYETLGVGPNATDDDLKHAYKKLIRQHHPDANPQDPAGAAERFKAVVNAYEQLSDPNKRARYELTRRKAPSQKKPAPEPSAGFVA